MTLRVVGWTDRADHLKKMAATPPWCTKCQMPLGKGRCLACDSKFLHDLEAREQEKERRKNTPALRVVGGPSWE